MTLDSKLKEILHEKRGFILVVDDRCDSLTPDLTNSDRMEVMQNKTLCTSRTSSKGVDVTIQEISHDAIQNASKPMSAGSCVARDLDSVEEEPTLIVVAANQTSTISSMADLVRSSTSVAVLKQMAPSAEIVYILPQKEKEVDAAIRKVASLFINPEVIESMETVDIGRFPTLMHMMAQKLTGRCEGGDDENSIRSEQHKYKNGMWKDHYLQFIDESLRAGNGQTMTDYHFLIMSDKQIRNLGREKNNVSAQEKIKVEDSSYALQNNDLENCAAIFIDNEWNGLVHEGNLGDGIETLRRIRKQMDERGVNIPIIYQTSHDVSDFSVGEKVELESLGAVLAPKDIFPKVCKKELSDKEVEMGKVFGKHERLEQYVARVHDFGKKDALGRDNLFVLCSRMASSEPIQDEEKDMIFTKLKLEDTLANHKMYVLSLFHSDLKEEIDNEKLQATSRDFYSFDEVIANASDYSTQLEPIRQQYTAILEKHRKIAPRVMTHNDAKDDNWFVDTVLGDFGSVQPGTEYKDIAKAVMNSALDREHVDEAIDAYVSIRKEHDSEFKPDDDFKQKVYEMIVTETMRTVHYKADQKMLADKLVKTAEMYSEILKEEYVEYRNDS